MFVVFSTNSRGLGSHVRAPVLHAGVNRIKVTMSERVWLTVRISITSAGKVMVDDEKTQRLQSEGADFGNCTVLMHTLFR